MLYVLYVCNYPQTWYIFRPIAPKHGIYLVLKVQGIVCISAKHMHKIQVANLIRLLLNLVQITRFQVLCVYLQCLGIRSRLQFATNCPQTWYIFSPKCSKNSMHVRLVNQTQFTILIQLSLNLVYIQITRFKVFCVYLQYLGTRSRLQFSTNCPQTWNIFSSKGSRNCLYLCKVC